MTHVNHCVCHGCTGLNEARATSDYWRTPVGISRRIEMLSEHFTYQVVNHSLMFYGQSAGIDWVRWSTQLDERVCIICGPLEGRTFRKGQFLPPLPAHANCLTPETTVHTKNGAIPIIDLRVGDHVLTHKGRYKRVIQLHKNKHEGKIYQINGNRLTGNHSLLTPKGWVAIDSINDGEQILCIAATNGHSNLPPYDLHTDTYNGFVYNLSVEDDESYVIGEDKIIVHNCRCVWELIRIPEEIPPALILKVAGTGFLVDAPTWSVNLDIISRVAVFLVLFLVDNKRERIKKYTELQRMLLQQGYSQIEVEARSDEELEFWVRRGFRSVGDNRLRKNIKK